MTTYIHEMSSGVKVEYRRAARSGHGVLHLEHRELKKDGQPYDDRWWPVSDEGLLNIQLAGSDIVELLSQEQVEAERRAADDLYNAL